MTQALKLKDTKELESTLSKTKNQAKLIDKLCSRIRKAEEVFESLMKECGLKTISEANDPDLLKNFPENLRSLASYLGDLRSENSQQKSQLSKLDMVL